jgi:peptidylprolyl isomerase
MRSKAILVALLLTASLAPGQTWSDAEREILTLQDQRSLGNGKLVSFLSRPDARLRYRALVALANIQDRSVDSVVATLLRDSDGSVRAAAAFALGQIGSAASQPALLGALREEKDTLVVGRILEALGRSGDGEGLNQVIDILIDNKNDYVAAEQAIAIARFALRGTKSEQSIWHCFELLSEPNADVRWKALFALWRSAPHGLIDVEIAKRESLLTALTRDPSADVRMNLATLLGKGTSSYSRDLILELDKFERMNPDWRVQVQIVKSFGALSQVFPELHNDLASYLESPNDHVTIATLQVYAALARQAVLASADTVALRGKLLKLVATRNADAELTRGEAFVVLARMFPDEYGKKNYYAEKDLSIRERTKVIEALSYVPTGRSFSVIFYSLDDENVRVAMAAWDFVRRFLTPTTIAKIRSGDQEWGDARGTLYRKTLNALNRHDMAITHLVANALADTVFFGIFREAGLSDSLVLAFKSAYELLSSPDDVEAMQAALVAMGRIGDARFIPTLEKALNDPDRTVASGAAGALYRITRQDHSAKIPQSSRPTRTDFDWPMLASISPSAKAVLKTNKGIVTLRLLKDDAPFTVLSFVKLAQKGFYKGLGFHRVVPNFVVQGGDPRGDGWGGPGYAIRSEFSFARFDRGAVGIASAGKDTEGCQFFMTHLPTPHLDGRFTVFARVVDGLNVVDRLQVGDVIESVTIEP